MGISLAWVAVKGLKTDTILARLALAPTGRSCDLLETGISMHPLSGGAHMKDLQARSKTAWWKRLWS